MRWSWKPYRGAGGGIGGGLGGRPGMGRAAGACEFLRDHMATTTTIATTIDTAHNGRTKIHDSTMVTLAITPANRNAINPVNLPTRRPTGGSTAAKVLKGPNIIENADA